MQMKRFKIAGLCLVAVFAVSAFAASGAQAGTLGKCVKVTKEGKVYKGHFLDKLCQTAATAEEVEKGGKKNKYNFVEAKNVKFTSSGGLSTLKGAAGEITCETNTDSGEFLNGKENRDVFTFHGCVLSVTGGKCTSVGAAEGEIVTNTLTSHLIDHGEKGMSGKEPAVGEVWLEFTNTPPQPYLAVFTCAPGITFKVTGSVSGTIGPVNKATKAGKPGKKPKYTFVIKFAKEVGEQDLLSTFNNPLEENKEVTAPSEQYGEGGAFLTEKGFEIKT